MGYRKSRGGERLHVGLGGGRAWTDSWRPEMVDGRVIYEFFLQSDSTKRDEDMALFLKHRTGTEGEELCSSVCVLIVYLHLISFAYSPLASLSRRQQ